MGCYEHTNEPMASIKCSEFLGQLSNCSLLKKDLPSWANFFGTLGLPARYSLQGNNGVRMESAASNL
jgi:hypothetical protein